MKPSNIRLPQKPQIQALKHFAQSLGVAFQIQDDLLNLQGTQYLATKGYSGEDIHEGKMTLMAIHCINQGGDKGQRLQEILAMKTDDQALIKEAIAIMNQCSSLEYARNRMKAIVDGAITKLDSVFEKSQPLEMLKGLAVFGIERNK